MLLLLLLNVRRMQGDLQKTLHCVASSTLLVVVLWCSARPTEGQSMPDRNDRAAPHADRYGHPELANLMTLMPGSHEHLVGNALQSPVSRRLGHDALCDSLNLRDCILGGFLAAQDFINVFKQTARNLIIISAGDRRRTGNSVGENVRRILKPWDFSE